mmetsp:Transcript_108896/g.338270  ORF Transcript_108896/g.338270 Transcript_108896/m.338270 type:complete len:108 (-) Transcript_108896:115-438(-)
MAAKATALPAVLAGALCLLLLRAFVASSGSEQAAFLSPQAPSTPTEQRQAGAALGAAVLPALSVAAVPGAAEAATEQELNRFGFVFAIFWLGAFVAGLARMLTTGKL